METLDLVLTKGVWTQATSGKIAFQNISSSPINIAYSSSEPTVLGEEIAPGDGRIVPYNTTVWLKCDFDTVTIAES
jgi:hypothetical protein